jgi:hypothetical protein
MEHFPDFIRQAMHQCMVNRKHRTCQPLWGEAGLCRLTFLMLLM